MKIRKFNENIDFNVEDWEEEEEIKNYIIKSWSGTELDIIEDEYDSL